MADALASLIEQARRRGVQLTGAPKKELTKAIQQSGKKGKGKTITAAEVRKGAETYEKSGGTDYLSTVGRTYAADQLAKDLRKKFKAQGYTKTGGYYTKAGNITQDVLNKATGAGFAEKDIRSYLAGQFAQSELNDEISQFMGQGNYQLDPTSGRWSKNPPITVDDETKPTEIGTVPGTQQGPYAGIDPNTAQGSTPAEIQYAMGEDPYKIQAKSAERLGRLERATNLDLGRLQQTTDLMGKKMAYGTEYDLAKVDRLKALQQAKIQQANYLYNLIPSAF